METPTPVQGTAFARAGLLGNPSDGYGGCVVAFTVGDFTARVDLRPAPRFQVPGFPPADTLEGLLARRVDATGLSALVLAALAQDRLHHGASPVASFALDVHTDVPRQVGLSGSSAVVVATLRAWHQWCGTPRDPVDVAQVAWDAETLQLGIVAGPQDRVIQSLEGLLVMDFCEGLRADRIERLAPDLLPPLFLAWSTDPGTSSGAVHDTVRQRYAAGDTSVREAMAAFAALAHEGRDCLVEGDREGLCRRVDENFDRRADLFQLGTEARRIVEVGRAAGAAVKFAGSGGGVVGVLREEADWPAVERAYREAGFRSCRPRAAVTQSGRSSKDTRRPSDADT